MPVSGSVSLLVATCKGGKGGKYDAINVVKGQVNSLSNEDKVAIANVSVESIRGGWETKYELAKLCGMIR